MTEPVVRCRGEDTLHDAAERMREHDVGALVVVSEEDRVVGMVTDRDICLAAGKTNEPLDQLPLQDFVSTPVLECDPDDSLETAHSTMQVNSVRRVVVVDPTRRPLGILSIDDLAAEALRELERGDEPPEIPPEDLVRTLGEIARLTARGHRPIPPGAEAVPRSVH